MQVQSLSGRSRSIERASMPTEKECNYNGITYHSMTEAAIAVGITLGAMNTRLWRGITSDTMLANVCKIKKSDVAWLRSSLAGDDVKALAKEYDVSVRYIRDAIQANGYFKDKFTEYEPRQLPAAPPTRSAEQQEKVDYILNSPLTTRELATELGMKYNTVYRIRSRR